MIRLIILDLDNTLYNWVDYYVSSFRAMLEELVKLTRLSEEELTASFKRVHQRHRTSEYAFAIEELDILKPVTQGMTVPEILEKYRSAIDAFRTRRAATLKLYPGVASTLRRLQAKGRILVAHTDAMMFYAVYRMKQLKIERFFDGLVAPKDHGLPAGVYPQWVRSHKDPDIYQPMVKYVRELDSTLVKPNPAIVRQILEDFRTKPHEAIYVGDSPQKDIYMAQQAGVHAVLAEYGRGHDPENYRKLVEITHWTDEDVQRELSLRQVKLDEIPFRISRFSKLLSVIRQIEAGEPLVGAVEERRELTGKRA